jgi:hypothetical protein
MANERPLAAFVALRDHFIQRKMCEQTVDS